MEVGVQRLSLVLPKAEQSMEEQDKVKKVMQLICRDHDDDIMSGTVETVSRDLGKFLFKAF